MRSRTITNSDAKLSINSSEKNVFKLFKKSIQNYLRFFSPTGILL
jgi:hypothetical protein